LKTEGRFDLDFGVSKQQQQSATVGFKSCQVQQLFQVVSSVCFDFVPSRGSPEDNKVWLNLTFSSSRRGGDQNKFETLTLEKFVGLSGQGFDFQPASRLCVNQEQQRQSRVESLF
jgi:hypothetical protein